MDELIVRSSHRPHVAKLEVSLSLPRLLSCQALVACSLKHPHQLITGMLVRITINPRKEVIDKLTIGQSVQAKRRIQKSTG